LRAERADARVGEAEQQAAKAETFRKEAENKTNDALVALATARKVSSKIGIIAWPMSLSCPLPASGWLSSIHH